MPKVALVALAALAAGIVGNVEASAADSAKDPRYRLAAEVTAAQAEAARRIRDAILKLDGPEVDVEDAVVAVQRTRGTLGGRNAYEREATFRVADHFEEEIRALAGRPKTARPAKPPKGGKDTGDAPDGADE